MDGHPPPMIHTSFSPTVLPPSLVSVCCFSSKETMGIYGGFSTSPLLTTTYFTYLCGAKTT